MMLIVTILLIAMSVPARAHEVGAAAEAWDWTTDLAIVLPLACTAGLYLFGVGRLWRSAGFRRGVQFWQFICFWLGWLSLVIALVSPLHSLGQKLFTAHMIEHEMLMVLAAPLLVAARPGAAMLWGLPKRLRATIGTLLRSSSVAGAWQTLSSPLVVTLVHGLALWAWHVPVLYNAALVSDAIHWLQHLSFLGTALLFWWPLLRGVDRDRVPGVAVLCLFITSLHSGLLGVLLTLARHPWYPAQSAAAHDWGLTSMEDQQLGGLVMWVPAGTVYAVAALTLAALWIANAAQMKGQAHAR
jgi:putative membrane protein